MEATTEDANKTPVEQSQSKPQPAPTRKRTQQTKEQAVQQTPIEEPPQQTAEAITGTQILMSQPPVISYRPSATENPVSQDIRPRVHLIAMLEPDCQFMSGLSSGADLPFTQNAVLQFAETESTRVVFGKPVENGAPIALLEAKFVSDATNEYGVSLMVRDVLPPNQGIGLSEQGPWVSKTRFTRFEVPHGVRAPLYLQNQGKLGLLVLESVTDYSPPTVSSDPQSTSQPVPVKRPARSIIQWLLRGFSQKRFAIISAVVVLAAVVLYYVDARIRGNRAQPPPPRRTVRSRRRSPSYEEDEEESYHQSSDDDSRTEEPRKRRRRRSASPPPRQQVNDDEADDIPDQI